MLKMKVDYMTIIHKVNIKQMAVDNKQAEINTLRTEYNNATDSKTQQVVLAKLQQPKEDLKKLKEDLQKANEELTNCPYSRTLKELVELQHTLEEKEQLETTRNLRTNIEVIGQSLEHSPIIMDGNRYTIQSFFQTKVNAVRERLERKLNLPQPEQTQEQVDNGRNNEDEGR